MRTRNYHPALLRKYTHKEVNFWNAAGKNREANKLLLSQFKAKIGISNVHNAR